MSLLTRLVESLAQHMRLSRSVDERRWVVLDVESGGLDAQADRLLAMAAVAVRHDGRRLYIVLGDSFEVVLRHDGAVADKPNILLHGIGVGAQRAGVEPRSALLAFERFIGQSPLIAFHAAFDQALILRAFDAALGRRPPNPWLDLEPLVAVLNPQFKLRSLDEWLAQLQIHCGVRHQAAADTLATAELLLKVWPAALRELGPDASFAATCRLAARRRWLP